MIVPIPPGRHVLVKTASRVVDHPGSLILRDRVFSIDFRIEASSSPRYVGELTGYAIHELSLGMSRSLRQEVQALLEATPGARFVVDAWTVRSHGLYPFRYLRWSPVVDLDDVDWPIAPLTRWVER